MNFGRGTGVVGGVVAVVRRAVVRGVVAGAIAMGSVGAVAFPASEARAQWGGMGGGMGADISITRQGFDAYVRLLGLDEEQKGLARELFDGNRKANKDLVKDMVAKFQAINEKARDSGGGDWQKMMQTMKEEMPKVAREFSDKSKAMEKSFFDDLKAICNPEQVEKFSTVERHRRREIQLRYGMITGMSTDLVEAARVAKVDTAKNPEVKAALDAYELDLDRLLVSWEKGQEDWQKKNMDSMFDGTLWMDEKKRDEMFKPMTDGAKQIRDLNRSVAKRVMNMLPEDQKAAFDLEIKRKEYPRVYRESHAEKTINEALKFTDLDASQKDALTSLKQGYVRDTASANEAWAKALEEREEKAGGRIQLIFSGQMWMGSGEEDGVTKAKKARKELDDKALDRVNSILKDDQKARLPQKTPPKGNAMGFDMFEDFGWEMKNPMEGGDED